MDIDTAYGEAEKNMEFYADRSFDFWMKALYGDRYIDLPEAAYRQGTIAAAPLIAAHMQTFAIEVGNVLAASKGEK